MGKSGHAKTTQRSEAMNHPKFTCNHFNQKQLADRWDLSERTLERWRAIDNYCPTATTTAVSPAAPWTAPACNSCWPT